MTRRCQRLLDAGHGVEMSVEDLGFVLAGRRGRRADRARTVAEARRASPPPSRLREACRTRTAAARAARRSQSAVVLRADQLHLAGRKKCAQHVVVRHLPMHDLFVVDGVALNEFFIGAQEWRGVGAAVMPDQHRPAARLQTRGQIRRAPVRAAGTSGKPARQERSRRSRPASPVSLGAALEHLEVGISSRDIFAGLPHLAIGLDANDAVAIFQKGLGENPVPQPTSAMRCGGSQPARLGQRVDDLAAVARPVFR